MLPFLHTHLVCPSKFPFFMLKSSGWFENNISENQTLRPDLCLVSRHCQPRTTMLNNFHVIKAFHSNFLAVFFIFNVFLAGGRFFNAKICIDIWCQPEFTCEKWCSSHDIKSLAIITFLLKMENFSFDTFKIFLD